MQHHTKDKGDLALYKTMAVLSEAGLQVALPVSEHLPFDLVIVRPDFSLLKAQVKYCGGYKSPGVIYCDTRSTGWTNGKGFYSKHVDTSLVDVYCVYSPETKDVYFIKTTEINTLHGFSIRLTPSSKPGAFIAEEVKQVERLL